MAALHFWRDSSFVVASLSTSRHIDAHTIRYYNIACKRIKRVYLYLREIRLVLEEKSFLMILVFNIASTSRETIIYGLIYADTHGQLNLIL